MDSNAIFAGLRDHSVSNRLKTLEQVRTSVLENGGKLLIPNLKKFFQIITLCLADVDYHCIIVALKLVSDMAPECESDIAPFIPLLLPSIIPNLAHEKIPVRDGVLFALRDLLSYKFPSDTLLAALIRHGFENDEVAIRIASVSCCEKLWASNDNSNKLYYSVEFYKRLLESLIARLRDVNDHVSNSAKQCIIYFMSLSPLVLGNEKISIQDITRSLSYTSQQTLLKYMPVSFDSGVPSLVNKKSNTDTPQKPSRATSSTSSVSHSAVSLDRTSTTTVSDEKLDLEYGFIPASLISQLKSVDRNIDYKVRNAAIEEILRLVLELKSSTILLPYLASFLRFISVLLNDSNSKIVLTSLDILNILLQSIPSEIKNHLSTALSRIIEKLSDKTLLLRQSVVYTIEKMLSCLPWDVLLFQLYACLKYPSSTVRENTVILLVHMSLLSETRQNSAFPSKSMALELVNALSDAKAKVVAVVTEALALLDSKLRNRLLTLDEFRDRIERSQLQALVDRFAAGPEFLPRLPVTFMDDVVGPRESYPDTLAEFPFLLRLNAQIDQDSRTLGNHKLSFTPQLTPSPSNPPSLSSIISNGPTINPYRSSFLAQGTPKNRANSLTILDPRSSNGNYQETGTPVVLPGGGLIPSPLNIVQSTNAVISPLNLVNTTRESPALTSFTPASNSLPNSSHTSANPGYADIHRKNVAMQSSISYIKNKSKSPDVASPEFKLETVPDAQDQLTPSKFGGSQSKRVTNHEDDMVRQSYSMNTVTSPAPFPSHPTSAPPGTRSSVTSNISINIPQSPQPVVDAPQRSSSFTPREADSPLMKPYLPTNKMGKMSLDVDAVNSQPKTLDSEVKEIPTILPGSARRNRNMALNIVIEAPNTAPSSDFDLSPASIPVSGDGMASALKLLKNRSQSRQTDTPTHKAMVSPPDGPMLSKSPSGRLRLQSAPDRSPNRSSVPANFSDLPARDLSSESVAPVSIRPKQIASASGYGRPATHVSSKSVSFNSNGGNPMDEDVNAYASGSVTPSGSATPSTARRRMSARNPNLDFGVGSSSSGEVSNNTLLDGVETNVPDRNSLNECDDPADSLASISKLITSSNWKQQYDGISVFRQLCIHSFDRISDGITSVFKTHSRFFLSSIESLRSQISRNAILLIADIAAFIPRAMEAEVDLVVTALFKRSADASAFIRTDVDFALCELAGSTMPLNRSLGALLLGAGGKTDRAKIQFCQAVECLINSKGAKINTSKEFDKLIVSLATLLNEGSLDIRKLTKKCLLLLNRVLCDEKEDLDKVLRRVCSSQQCLKVKEVLEKGEDISIPSSRSRSASGIRPRTSMSSGSKSSVSGRIDEDESTISASSNFEEVEEKRSQSAFGNRKLIPASSNREVQGLNEVLLDMGSSEWKSRAAAIEKMLTLLPSICSQSDCSRLFDAFIPRLSDSNSKINLSALEALLVVLPVVKGYLTPVTTILVTSLSTNIASNNAQVKSLSEEGIALLTAVANTEELLQPFCSVIVYGNIRTRPFLIQKMSEFVEAAFATKPAMVIKHVLPVIGVLLDETKIEVKKSVALLLQALHRSFGSNLFSQAQIVKLSPANMKKLEEALK